MSLSDFYETDYDPFDLFPELGKYGHDVDEIGDPYDLLYLADVYYYYGIQREGGSDFIEKGDELLALSFQAASWWEEKVNATWDSVSMRWRDDVTGQYTCLEDACAKAGVEFKEFKSE